MAPIRFLHFSCFCGADLYFLHDISEGTGSGRAVAGLKSQLGNTTYTLFSAADGRLSVCSHCGMEVELPEPRIVSFLAERVLPPPNLLTIGAHT